MLNSQVKKRKKPFKKRLKREYYKFVDSFVRSHALQKLILRTVYLVCFIASIILATLLYIETR